MDTKLLVIGGPKILHLGIQIGEVALELHWKFVIKINSIKIVRVIYARRNFEKRRD
jgi:hypothetical protein